MDLIIHANNEVFRRSIGGTVGDDGRRTKCIDGVSDIEKEY